MFVIGGCGVCTVGQAISMTETLSFIIERRLAAEVASVDTHRKI